MSRTTRRTRWALAVPMVVLAMGAATAWWLVTPSAFPDDPDPLVIEDPADGSVWLVALPAPTEQVTVSSARPTPESAGTSATVVVCQSQELALGGLLEGRAVEVCDEVTDVIGAVLGPDTPDRTLALELRVTEGSAVSLSGVSVAYTQGLRFGRQEIVRPVSVSYGAE